MGRTSALKKESGLPESLVSLIDPLVDQLIDGSTACAIRRPASLGRGHVFPPIVTMEVGGLPRFYGPGWSNSAEVRPTKSHPSLIGQFGTRLWLRASGTFLLSSQWPEQPSPNSRRNLGPPTMTSKTTVCFPPRAREGHDLFHVVQKAGTHAFARNGWDGLNLIVCTTSTLGGREGEDCSPST